MSAVENVGIDKAKELRFLELHSLGQSILVNPCGKGTRISGKDIDCLLENLKGKLDLDKVGEDADGSYLISWRRVKHNVEEGVDVVGSGHPLDHLKRVLLHSSN